MADDTADGERATGEVPPADEHPEHGGGFLAVVRETVIVVALSLLIATLVRIFLVQAFLIPSQSMEQTLLVGDRVLVSKLTTRFDEVERGDVVVFEDPNGWLGPLVQAPAPTGLAGWLREGLVFVGVLPDDAAFTTHVVEVAPIDRRSWRWMADAAFQQPATNERRKEVMWS